jgi:hypothetical protein
MNEQVLLSLQEARTGMFRRGRIVIVEVDGSVVVTCDDAEGLQHHCDVLEASDVGLRLSVDDAVFVWLAGDDQRGIVLGRLGASHAPLLPNEPDELVIEATKSLTLRVGEGSITIREDGKILIKGKDLVSHAQRMNRIKGGAVSIN